MHTSEAKSTNATQTLHPQEQNQEKLARLTTSLNELCGRVRVRLTLTLTLVWEGNFNLTDLFVGLEDFHISDVAVCENTPPPYAHPNVVKLAWPDIQFS